MIRKKASDAVLDPPGAAAGLETRLVESLYERLYGRNTTDSMLLDRVAELETAHGEGVHSDLIFLLSHLRFEPAEARQHRQRIREHRDSMKAWRGTEVDLRVALVSYFVEVNRNSRRSARARGRQPVAGGARRAVAVDPT